LMIFMASHNVPSIIIIGYYQAFRSFLRGKKTSDSSKEQPPPAAGGGWV
jgi:hypothetical protein